MKIIPGTSIPLCLCCEESAASVRDCDLGHVCSDCAGYLLKARAILARHGIVRACDPPIKKQDQSD